MIDAMLADAKLSVKQSDGTCEWDHLEQAAQFGHPRAIEKLNAVPEYPDAVEYMREIFAVLQGRSGFTPTGGVAPLSWETLDRYQSSTGRRLTESEQLALIKIDSAMIHDELKRAEEKAKAAQQNNPPSEPD